MLDVIEMGQKFQSGIAKKYLLILFTDFRALEIPAYKNY